MTPGPNKALQQTAATGIALPGLGVAAVAAAAELGRSAVGSIHSMSYFCPCCGYPELDCPAYLRLGQPPWNNPGPPPYDQWYGEASYDVCECCGFEFGNDDNPGTAPPLTFEAFRREWMANGCLWFDPTRRPEDWQVDLQLAAAWIVGQAEQNAAADRGNRS
jgi:hypothetical protein